jgi:two-component system chemotaxis response regulator CheB
MENIAYSQKSKQPIRVLIIDDSAVVRKVMSAELSRYSDLEIVGTAIDPYVAREKIIELRPDVITLDLEMPRMDGLSFLARLMRHYPMPVVVLSSLTPKNGELALQAMDLGALDVICKPGGIFSGRNISQLLVHAIRRAASSKINVEAQRAQVVVDTVQADDLLVRKTHKIIAIGASTGGTKAIEAVLRHLPPGTPGILIVQHMPENFTASFAKRLNEICAIEVREACHNDRVRSGTALIAPGNRHMLLQRDGGDYRVKIKAGPRVHYQRPSVDVLFQSVAEHAGRNAIGIMLTGMGADGARGMLRMKQSCAHNIAQDETSSVVFGMPKAAIKQQAVDEVVSLSKIPAAIIKALQND